MESVHFPIKVSEDIIHVYQNGPEHSDLEHGQNHYIKGHFFQLSTNFSHVSHLMAIFYTNQNGSPKTKILVVQKLIIFLGLNGRF